MSNLKGGIEIFINYVISLCYVKVERAASMRNGVEGMGVA